MTEDKNSSHEVTSTNEVVSKSRTAKNSLRKKVLKRLGQASLSLLSVAFMAGSALAVDASEAASNAIGAEGSKKVLNQARKVAKSKPALSLAAGITCIACLPAAGVVAVSPSMCIAYGILIAKVLG